MVYHKRQDPTRFPHTTEVRLHTGVSPIAFPATFKDSESFVAFKMNAKNLDAIAFRDRAKEVGDTGLTVDDVRATVKEGVAFVGLEPDGNDKFTCIRCTREFQPVIKPKTNGGFSGNFRTYKAEEVDKLDDLRKKIANDVTAWFLGSAEGVAPPTDLKTRVAPICSTCKKVEIEAVLREQVRLKQEGSDREIYPSRYLVIEDVVDALYVRDSSIQNAINRKKYDEVVGRRTDTRCMDNRGGQNSYRDNRPGGRGNRPRGDRKAWIKTTVAGTVHSFELYPQVADTLDRLVSEGKIEKSLEALLNVTPVQLEAMGLEYAAKIQDLASKHLDFLAREAKKAEVAGSGRVSIGEAAGARS